MSGPYHYPFQTPWPTAMDQLRRIQQPTLSPQYQQLIDLVNRRFNSNTDSEWEDIRSLSFSPEELESAIDYALNLYTQWLSEDLRVLWPLLGDLQGENARIAIRDASESLERVTRDRLAARSNRFAILLRLCAARWQLRDTANAISRAAGR